MQRYTYAIGDIHGNITNVHRALSVIKKHRGERFAHLNKFSDTKILLEDTIVFLGDYIDRGMDSASVLELFSTEGAVKTMVDPEYGNTLVVHILGNHDQMFLLMLDRIHRWGSNKNQLDKDYEYAYAKRFYDQYGGEKTDLSYLIMNSSIDTSKPKREFVGGSMYPLHHLQFLRSLRYHYYDNNRIFVHGYCPRDDNMLFAVKNKKDDDYTPEEIERALINAALNNDDTLWSRFKSFDNYKFADRHIVHGHTPVETPELFSNRTNLDTNSWKTGLVHIGVFDRTQPGGPVTIMDTNDFTVSWFEGMKK